MTKPLLALYCLLALQLCVPAPAFADDLCPNGCGVCRKPEGCGCDQGGKWLDKYREAQARLIKSSVLSDRILEELDERMKENLKELGVHGVIEGAGKGAEKAAEQEAVKKVLGRLTMKIGEAAAEKAAFWVEIAATLAALAELGYENWELYKEVAEMSKQAEQAAAEGNEFLDEAEKAIQAELANDKLCNDARKKALAANLLDSKARDLVKGWEDENGRILDPNTRRPFLDFRAAMNRAKQILGSESHSGSRSPSLMFVAESDGTPGAGAITEVQRQSAVSEIRKGRESWEKAMTELERAARAQESINQQLHALLSGFASLLGQQSNGSQKKVPPPQEGKLPTKGKEKPQPDVATKGVGHLVPTFPADVNVSNTLIRAYTPGGTKAIQTGIGEQALSLPPGTYDVEVSNLRVVGVTIQGGQETKLRVGVLRVTADSQTTYDVLEPTEGRKLASGFGIQTIGLPVGNYQVRIRGKLQPVMIEEGKITDLH